MLLDDVPVRLPPGNASARSGHPGPSVRAARAGLAVAVGLSLLVAVVLWQRFGVSGPAAGVRGFAVLSDTAVRVELEVRKDPASTVLCSLRARERSGEQVGTALVRVGPAPEQRVRAVHEIPTSARAVTGEVLGCVADPTAAPR